MSTAAPTRSFPDGRAPTPARKSWMRRGKRCSTATASSSSFVSKCVKSAPCDTPARFATSTVVSRA